MKKTGLFVLCLILFSVLLSSCSANTTSPIKYERKFGKYFGEEKGASGEVIDLSEGPKLNYDAKLGPRDLNFDIKIVNPY